MLYGKKYRLQKSKTNSKKIFLAEFLFLDKEFVHWDKYIHFSGYSYNVSAIVDFGLLQVYTVIGNLCGIFKPYPGLRIFLFSFPCIRDISSVNAHLSVSTTEPEYVTFQDYPTQGLNSQLPGN